MAKFTNIKYKNTVNSIVDSYKNRMNNPWYIYTDSKPSLVKYYNVNQQKSSLDDSMEVEYNVIGKDSPIKYNLIEDFCLYGIDKIALNLNITDFGLESSSVEGEAIILPNTIKPNINDYFSLNYYDKDILFRVIAIDVDTVENGVNFYKINYKIDKIEKSELINKQVVDKFTMIINNIGTNFKPIIKLNEFNYMQALNNIINQLNIYYISLFYSKRVQTLIFRYKDNRFYDPYMIEFVKRNEILNNTDNYIYIDHKLSINATFPLDYDRTIFRFIECREINKRKPLISIQGKYIDDDLSIFGSRFENYYKINYVGKNSYVNQSNYIFEGFPQELLDRIYDNNKYKLEDDDSYKNIIIKYINNEDITKDDLDLLKNIEFDERIELFYIIPILIFIFNEMIKLLLVSSNK